MKKDGVKTLGQNFFGVHYREYWKWKGGELDEIEGRPLPGNHKILGSKKIEKGKNLAVKAGLKKAAVLAKVGGTSTIQPTEGPQGMEYDRPEPQVTSDKVEERRGPGAIIGGVEMGNAGGL